MSDQSSGAMTLWSRARAPVAATTIAIVLVGAAVLLAPVSQVVALAAVATILLALVVYLSLRWPRAMIVMVVLSPILDRYVVAGVLPADFPAHFVSEGLLLSVSVTLGFHAWRTGRLRPALRHPVTVALLAFVLLAGVSALLNGVPPLVALVGVGFTVDAAALYFLPRLVGFSVRQAILAIAAFVAVVTAASVIVMLQAILAPDIFGLRFVTGRFGEIYRLAGFIGDPNVFGTFAAAASPFALLAATVRQRRWQAFFAALAFLLVLTLWLSFSRGAWLAMVLGVLGVLLILDRRTLLLAIGVLVLSFVTAEVMPRDLAIPVGGPGPARPDLVDSTIGRVDTVGSGRDLRTLFVINAVPILADHPALGVGPGRYGGAAADLFGTPIYTRYGTDELFTNRTQRTVDNFWLHLVVEAGLLGLAAFLSATLVAGLPILSAARGSVAWRRVLLGGAAAASAALAVSAISTMLLEANSVAFLFWFLLGVGSVIAAPTTARAP